MTTELITVIINGTKYSVEKGARLIDVCRENAHDIPAFCYYKDLELQASCRMCLVRIEKMPKLQTSCTIICTDGMSVTTNSEEVKKAQRGMAEFLLVNHPLDCPVCDRGGECELQEVIFDWGDLEERFYEPKNYRPEKYLSPMVANDPQRCILCKRCTRVCDEWMGEQAIEAEDRGANTIIGTFGDWLNCTECGNCIEVCPTGTLLDGTYRHQTRPWELTRTISTCTFCSDGCQMSLGSRNNEVVRIVARDRYVDGINGEFLCVKGRFAHPFINHPNRLKTPLIRYSKGGKLIPSTWDQALEFAATKLAEIYKSSGADSIGVVGSPRLTNESNYALLKFARDVIGTTKITASETSPFTYFFNHLSAPLATHHDIRHAKTILLIGGEPEELQPLTAKQIRQAVRNGQAKLVIVNATPIRLTASATKFLHIRPESEDAIVFALTSSSADALVARKTGVEESELAALRQLITEAEGNVVLMLGGEVTPQAQALFAQIPEIYKTGSSAPRFLLHPLTVYNNSVGAYDIGLVNDRYSVTQVLNEAGTDLRAVYMTGSLTGLTEEDLEKLSRLDLLIVPELFETETTEYADVVFPAASYAEVDGTFTNNAGLVQRVRQSIPPVNLSKPDWMITSELGRLLVEDFALPSSASDIFREIAANIPAYEGLRYPLLKDESKPVQVKHKIMTTPTDLLAISNSLRARVESLDESREKITATPKIGHELFKPGILTSKVPQFPLLDSGNPKPPSVLTAPLYQITVDANLRRSTLTTIPT